SFLSLYPDNQNLRWIIYMTLVVDIGNTNIVCGIYNDDSLVWHARFRTDSRRTADEYFALLNSLRGSTWEISAISNVIIASVVPDLTRMWQHLSTKHFGKEALILNAYSDIGLSYVVKDPGFIGADLVANAFAVWKKYKSNTIIIDFGTATTLQLVSSAGKFMGAIIAPGMKSAATELFEKAALLSEIELTTPPVLLGTNTKDAMLSGIVKGHAMMVESFIQELKKEYQSQSPLQVIATGGISDLLAPFIPSITLIDRTLTIEGIYLAAKTLLGSDIR
ncbi:MAG: type III pantothenate kinase, partial [Candidatus Cloacimonadaceae bacterium]